MDALTLKVNLDCLRKDSQAIINAKVGEANGRKVVFTLYEGRTAFFVPAGASVIFRAQKPDGTILYNNCVIDDGKVEYTITSQTVAVAGVYACELQIVSDGRIIYSPYVTLNVMDNLYSDTEVESSNEFTELENALNRIPSLEVIYSKYTKPEGGIPKSDLANDVQASLDKAENAVEYFEVTLTTQNGVSTADKTFAQVKTAVESGTPVLKVHSDGAILWFFLLDKSPTEIDFVGLVDEQIIAYLAAKQDGTWETTVAARVTAEMLSSLNDKIGNIGQLTTTDKTNLVAAINEVKQSGGGGSTVELDTTLTQSGKAADAKAVGDALKNLSVSGLTTAQVNALNGMFKVAAYIKADVSAEYTAFKTAFGISEVVTLSSISVTYDGGDVAVGTAVTALNGVVVTAIYSDGSTEIATGYTISGIIAEGQNTVTVTYQGKTATFTVTGVAESSGGETGVSNESTWTDGVPYTYDVVNNTYIESNGTETAYNNWSSSPYLYCAGASQLVFTVLLNSSMLSSNNNYNAFYDENKTFISKFSIAGIENASLGGAEVGATKEITIPENAAYFRVSHKGGVYGNIDFDNPILSITPKA